MPRLAGTLCWLAPVLAAWAGCTNNSWALKGQVQQLQQQQIELSQKNQELQTRVTALDRGNQEKDILTAQAEQRAQVAEDQLAAVKEQLRTMTTQLAQLREQEKSSQQRVRALNASLRRRGAAVIRPNNSLEQTLPVIDLPGVEVRRDGDVIRVELPGSTLFPRSDGRLSPEGVRLVTQVAGQLAREYPRQRIRVEGHTSTAPLPGGVWPSRTQLSLTEALVVFNVMVKQLGLSESRLGVAGHGAAYPVVSNATPAGQQRNHRVELVVYPEKVGS